MDDVLDDWQKLVAPGAVGERQRSLILLSLPFILTAGSVRQTDA